jgi:hypothetical protein
MGLFISIVVFLVGAFFIERKWGRNIKRNHVLVHKNCRCHMCVHKRISLLVLVLVLGGCASVQHETTIERAERVCQEMGGTWGKFGCMFTDDVRVE